MVGDQLSPSAVQRAASAYFGEIAEDGFWKDIVPQRVGILSHLTKKSLPFEDGVALHKAALTAIMGSPEKGIEPVKTLSEMQNRLESVFNIASQEYRWKSKRLAKEISRKAKSTALAAARQYDGIEGISL